MKAEIISHSSGLKLPALIEGAGKRAAWRFVEFFGVNIRNPNTRAAYGRAAGASCAGAKGRGLACLAMCSPSTWPRMSSNWAGKCRHLP